MTGTAKRFSTNVWSLTVSQILYRGASILVVVYIGKVLGVAVLGQYAIIMGVINLYLNFSDLGVSNYVIKEVSRDRSLGEVYLNNFFVLQILVGVALIGIALLTGTLSGYSTTILIGIAIGSLGLVFNGMANSYKALLSAHELLHPFAYIEILCMLVYVIGNGYVMLSGGGVLELVGVTVLVQLAKYMAGVVWANRYNMRVRLRSSVSVVKSLLVMGMPFLLFNSAHFAIQRLDVMYIGAIGGEEPGGLYASATRLVYSSLFVIAVIGTALYPVLSRLLAEDRDKLQRIYTKVQSYTFIVACGAALLLFASAPVLMHEMFGEKFDSAIPVLQISCWYLPAFAVGLLPSNLLMAGGNVWSAARFAILSVVLMTVCVFLLYPYFGIAGVAWIVVGVELLLSAVYIVLSIKHFGLGIRGTSTAAVAILTAGSVALYYIVPIPGEYLQLALPAVAFVLSLFVFRIITASDITDIKNLFLKKPDRLA